MFRSFKHTHKKKNAVSIVTYEANLKFYRHAMLLSLSQRTLYLSECDIVQITFIQSAYTMCMRCLSEMTIQKVERVHYLCTMIALQTPQAVLICVFIYLVCSF